MGVDSPRGVGRCDGKDFLLSEESPVPFGLSRVTPAIPRGTQGHSVCMRAPSRSPIVPRRSSLRRSRVPMSHVMPARGDRCRPRCLPLPLRFPMRSPLRAAVRSSPCSSSWSAAGRAPSSSSRRRGPCRTWVSSPSPSSRLREILEAAPGHPEANYRLGLALARTRQINSAIWRLERAAESSEFAALANLSLVSLYLTFEGLPPRARRGGPGAGAVSPTTKTPCPSATR